MRRPTLCYERRKCLMTPRWLRVGRKHNGSNECVHYNVNPATAFWFIWQAEPSVPEPIRMVGANDRR
jgi:hypothetical protein